MSEEYSIVIYLQCGIFIFLLIRASTHVTFRNPWTTFEIAPPLSAQIYLSVGWIFHLFFDGILFF